MALFICKEAPSRITDGTNTYIYGLDRIAQVNTGTEYFLGDALESVRQLTNQSGAITYTSAYDPYGVAIQTLGSSQSAYSYTGEYSGEYNEFVYLRARHYAPRMGRFITKDTWIGSQDQPMSYNSWLYVYANPIHLKDPSGRQPWLCPVGMLCSDQTLAAMQGELTSETLESVYQRNPYEAVKLVQNEFGINLPPRYQFKFAYRSSSVFPASNIFKKYNIYGAIFWFTELHGIQGEIFEFSDVSCALLSSAIPADATLIDYSVYVTDEAFTHYDFHPDDVAGTMIHEAVHAWQENLVRDNLDTFISTYSMDPRSLEWAAVYKDGMERQAIDLTYTAHIYRAIDLSQLYLRDSQEEKSGYAGGPASPFDIRLYGQVIR